MTELLVVLLVVAAVVVALRVSKRRALERDRATHARELEPVKKLAYEDITALGTDLPLLNRS